MSVSRVIEVSFGGGSIAYAKVDTAYFYNNGIILKPTDIDLPTSYQVHWADSPQASSTLETIGTAEGAPIPDDLWDRSKVIYGWIYLHPTQNSGVTGYEVRIYKNVRAGLPDGTEPTPAEQSTIDQLITALNTAVEDAQDAQQAIEDMTVSAESLAEGASATVTKSEQDGVVHLAFGIPVGATGATGATGETGVGIASTVLNADYTLTITLTDGTSYTTPSIRGASGADGADGSDGNGIASAVLNADYTLTLTFTDGTTYTTPSIRGAQGETGQTGATGATPSFSIGTVTTLEPTESATATITGTPENPVLNLGIPQGEQGEITTEEFLKAFPTDTASGAIASFSDGADNLPLKSLIVDINPVQDLHGQDAPYPAGGGKNKIGPSAMELGTLTSGYNPENRALENGKYYYGFSATNYYYPAHITSFIAGDNSITFSSANAAYGVGFAISASANTSYAVSFTSSDTVYASISYYDANGAFLSSSQTYSVNFTVTTPASTAMALVIFRASTANTKVTFNSIQFEQSSTVTAFAPYENLCPISGLTEVAVNHSDADMTNPTTITISLGQTVYGGKVDVLSGELTVYPYYASYNGETLTGEWISDRDKYVAGTTPTIGAQVVNIGAQGVTVQLSANQINSLLGVNNIWADSGDTTAEYRADTKLFIERLTAPDSVDMVADTNITSGKYFMVGNSLYKATANIANGSAIIVGTNAVRKSLSEALNEINA